MKRYLFIYLLLTLFATPYVLTEQTRGLPDKQFNPNGFEIDASGNPVPGLYAGALTINLGGGGGEEARAMAIDSQSRFILAGRSAAGTGPSFNFAVTVVTATGLLDRSFNPNGFSIDSNGAFVSAGGYSGTLLIDLGGSETCNSLVIDTLNNDRIILAGQSTTGPTGPDGLAGNFAVVVLSSTGLLDTTFNPSGFSIDQDGNQLSLGGYAGSILVDLGSSSDDARAVALNTSNQIVLAGVSNTGPGATMGGNDNFAVVVLTPTGLLEQTFNPEGFYIGQNGNTAGIGYSGSIIIALVEGGSNSCNDMVIDSNNRIILGGNAETGPAPFSSLAVVALTSTGLLDRNFNPSGRSINGQGNSIDLGGYAGSILIDLGSSTFDLGDALAIDPTHNDRIVFGGFARTGPGAIGDNNFAAVVLTATGLLDTTFNPSGLSINVQGEAVSAGGYSGSIITVLSTGNTDQITSIAIDASGCIVLAGVAKSSAGPVDDFAAVVLTPKGNLDTTFNPGNVSIDSAGTPVAGGAYSGSIVLSLGGIDLANSVAIDSAGRVALAGRAGADFAIVLLNATTILPPPPPPSALFQLPFVALAAA